MKEQNELKALQNQSPNFSFNPLQQQDNQDYDQLKEIAQGRWSEQEHKNFLAGLMTIGKDWRQLQIRIKSRTSSQVRSHAQKYFLKLNKIHKERKKSKNKMSIEPTDLENQILQMFQEDDITDKTPSEIISVLKRQFHSESTEPKKKLIVKRNEQTQKMVIQSVKKHKTSSDEIIRLMGMYEQQQDQSYFKQIIMKKILDQSGKYDINNLIDFGIQNPIEETELNKHQLVPEDQAMIVGRRKKSFTLFDQSQEIDADQLLQQTLQKVRRGNRK